MFNFQLGEYQYDTQTSQIKPNRNLKSLTKSNELLENLNFKLLCDVNFPLFPGQYIDPYFTNGQSKISWVPLAAKRLKSYQIETKNL